MIVGGLLVSKYLAAVLAGHVFGYDTSERRSLTTPQAAATLAAGVVAFKTLNPAGQRLIDEPVINTILVLVIVTAVGETADGTVRGASSAGRQARLRDRRNDMDASHLRLKVEG